MATSSALSAGDITNLRAGGHTTKVRLSIAPIETVATARINQSSFAVPLAELTVDNTSAGWLTDVTGGMSVWIGTTAGARDIGVYRVRKAPTADTLYLMEMSSGDPGLLVLSDLAPLQNNAYITIQEDFNLWSVFPHIIFSGDADVRSGDFRKDYDIAYSDQNETTIPFVLRIGQHRAGEVDGSGNVSFVFNADVEVFNGESVVSYSWDMAGNTYTSGSSSSQNPTVQFAEGKYWISCTVTLDSGASQTARRVIHAWGDTSTVLSIQILSDRRDIYGRKVRFRVKDGLGDLRNGGMALLHEEPSWGDNDISSATRQFVGFVQRAEGNSGVGITEEEFELVSAIELLRQTKSFGQQLTIADTPANWQEVIASISHLDFWVFYLLIHHSTLLTLFDFEPSDPSVQSYLTGAWSVPGGSMFRDLQSSGERLNCAIGQRSDGTLLIRRDVQMMDASDRSSVIERMTLTESDIGVREDDSSPGLLIQERVRPAVGLIHAQGLIYAGQAFNAVLAWGQGHVPGQGTGVITLDGQLVKTQAELNERASNKWAEENNPYEEITLHLKGNYDVFEPAERYWVRLSVASAYWTSGSAFNRRCSVKTVTASYRGGGVKLISLTLIPETSGYSAPGQTRVVVLPETSENAPYVIGNTNLPLLTALDYSPNTGLLQFSYQPFVLDNPRVIKAEAYPEETGLYALAWKGANAYFTSGAFGSSPVWVAVNSAVSGNPVDFFHAPISDYVGGTGPALRAYLLTDEEFAYTADVSANSVMWSNETAMTTAQLLRAVNGYDNGVIALGADITAGAWSEDIDLTATNGLFVAPVWGSYTPGTGWEDTDSNGGDWKRRIYIKRLFGQTTITEVSGVFDATTGGNGPFIETVVEEPQTDYGHTALSTSTVYTDEPISSGTISHADAVTIAFSIQLDNQPTQGALAGTAVLKSAHVEGTGLNPFADTTWVRWSDDNGASFTKLTVGIYNGLDQGVDVMDFDPWVIVAASNFALYSNGGADTDDFAEISGTSVYNSFDTTGFDLDHPSRIMCVRIPYRTLDNARLNNDDTALHLVYGTDPPISDQSLWHLILDNSDRSYSYTDITPDIGGTKYYVVGPNALEISGVDGRVINAFVKPAGGGDTVLVRSEDGGATWTAVNSSFDGDYVRFIVGSTRKLTVSGTDGIKYSLDGGTTLVDQLGNLTAPLTGYAL